MRARVFSYDQVLSVAMTDTAPKAPLEMETELNPAELKSINAGVQIDRRRNLRIYEHFALKVRGVDAEGEKFDIDTVIENLSSGGLYFRLNQRVALGERLFFVIYMLTVREEQRTAPVVAAHGKVIRSESKDVGSYGMGVAFYHHRFL